MAKQGKGGPTPPPDDKKHPGESDILEVVPIDEPAPPKPPTRKHAAATQLGGPPSPGESDIIEVVPEDVMAEPAKPAQKPPTDPDLEGPAWVEPADLEEEVEVVEEVIPEIVPTSPSIELSEARIEEVKGHTPPPVPPPAVAEEDIHEVDLWEDEPAEVEVVEEVEAKKPDEPAPKPKTLPDDVAGADDFVELIEPAMTPPVKPKQTTASEEDIIIDVTPGPLSSPLGKGDSARADKIAEALESGTDLTGERQALSPPASVSPPEFDYDSDLDKGPESSAVNLGEPPPSKRLVKAEAEEDFVDLAGMADAEPKAAAAEEAPAEVIAAEVEAPPVKAVKQKTERKASGIGLRWVAGILIGLALGGGAVAGLGYMGLIGAGEKKAPQLPGGPKISKAQQAHTAMDSGNYDEAIQLLQGADKSTPEELAIRGEARWLKYLKEQKDKKAAPNAKDEAVQQALADLKEASDEVRQQQILLALGGGDDEGSKKLLKLSEANLAKAREQLNAAETERKKALAQNKLLTTKANDAGKNVALLLDARKKLMTNLTEINTQLKAAKVADGPAGVRELVAMKEKLETEKGRLDGVVKQAVQELAAAKILPEGATEKDLIAGVKAARQRSDSPLAAPLAKGVSVLAGASENAARWLQQNAKNAAMQAELTAYRLREPLIRTPEQRLDSWITRLRSGAPASPADLDEARRDADWVVANAGKRVPELKNKAEVLQALVARERGGSAQAREVLARIVKDSAAKDPAAAAAASFDLGRLDEADGDLAKAEAFYRQAIKLSGGSPKAASRYRAALARVLLMRLDASPAEMPPAKEQKTGRLSPGLTAAFFVTTVVFEDEGEQPPVQDKRLKEALDLANELLQSENREDKGNAHIILGKVYTLQGKKTEGLKEYVLGLQLLYPGLATRDLSRMIETHPAFQQPESLARPNVAAASHHYGRGLERFWNRQYGSAEEELKKAVANDPDDARYRYYLGLSRYLQNSKSKREAATYDFEQAARLERHNRPEPVVVNASFERLPYSLRQMLNSYRQRSPTPTADEVAGR
jgi:tetratricopeptide (TPR) repeat protein